MRINCQTLFLQSCKSGKSHKSQFRQAHGVEIKVETKEGERAEFIIRLPNV